ncbi:MAG: hypothetical protein M3Y82_12850 [Verrucomicrobiota bacterium]|nr:hypothetical protein [Verrucomicrobiota bacterium]
MKNIQFIFQIATLLFCVLFSKSSLAESKLQTGVRGVATRAPREMKIDGDLSEFKDAFCAPVEYFQPETVKGKNGEIGLADRAAQFFFMWDEEAFYAGLRTLDAHPNNSADDDHLWEGDAVEWYFDTRQNENFRSHDWPKTPNAGAVHCYWTGLKGTNVQPRFCLRPGFLEAIANRDVQVGARRTKVGMDVEFKLPWKNFPEFKAALGKVIALDAELCYSDGGPRVFRSFTFGSPLSVQQPANLGKIQLVEKLEAAHWTSVGQVMCPIRCDTAWSQPGKPQVTGYLALPPNRPEIGKIEFEVFDLNGKPLGHFPGKIEMFETEGNFQRAVAQWPNDLAIPGQHYSLGIVYDKSGKELTRIAPRMVSVNMAPGY